jgi:hypothetical protein
MFSNAYELASGFTNPVITSIRFSDNSVESSLGSFVILNEEGWIITAGHILNSFVGFQNHQKELSKHNDAINEIQHNPTLLEQQKLKKISQLKRNFEKQRRIINHSFWWGADKLNIETFHVNFDIDLAIGRLFSLPKGLIKEYPKIINPQSLKLGTSLCKLGYPFYNIKTTWNSKTNGFEVDPKLFPIPRFPLEGMYTRNAILGTSKDKKYERKFIETSSPGLRGQSGGPIFDVSGRIWAIQSQTISLPLGFSPKLKKGNKETIEHQFINVGLGVHTEIIVKFLNEFGVKFEMS